MTLQRNSSSRLSPQDLELLREAGYDLDDPWTEKWGALALETAMSVEHYIAGDRPTAIRPTTIRPTAIRPTAIRPTTAPGRNQPCPCGSGRKYKRCCIDVEAPAQPPAQATPLRPEFVPVLDGGALMRRDIIIVSGLLKNDPDLGEIRYDHAEVTRYLRALDLDSLAVETDPEAIDARNDRLAQRFHVQYAGAFPDDLPDRFLLAASRAPEDAALRRGAALGIMLAAMERAPAARGASLLATMVFRHTVQDIMDREAKFDGTALRLADALAEHGVDVEALARGDRPPPGLLEKVISRLPGRFLKRMTRKADRMLSGIDADLADPAFPARFGCATVLPALRDVLPLRNKSDLERVTQAITDHSAALVHEDWALFARRLEMVLADPATPRRWRKTCETLQTMVKLGATAAFEDQLTLASISFGPSPILPADDDLMRDGEFPDAEALERYAQALRAEGYPALADRVAAMAASDAERT